jgi:hypothetical protein
MFGKVFAVRPRRKEREMLHDMIRDFDSLVRELPRMHMETKTQTYYYGYGLNVNLDKYHTSTQYTAKVSRGRWTVHRTGPDTFQLHFSAQKEYPSSGFVGCQVSLTTTGNARSIKVSVYPCNRRFTWVLDHFLAHVRRTRRVITNMDPLGLRRLGRR